MKIDRKIRVFISSKCGEQYSVARKALKAMLEETSICEAYAFETDYATSVPVVSAYLSELKDSDVIIVLVDNEDGVTDPVQSEINRARELQKKMIYVFCDEKRREPTVLQEQLKENLLEKYDICHEFSDFPIVAYNSFFNDITRQYRLFEVVEDVSRDEECESPKKYGEDSFWQIRKDNFTTIKSVKNTMKRLSGICFYEKLEYEDVDKQMDNLLLVLLGQLNLSDVDFSVLEKHWRQIYSEELQSVVACRKQAFISYLGGQYQESLEILENAVEKNKDFIPQWMLNDIAIDIRNIDVYIAYRRGLWICSNPKGQKILDEDNNCLFNPIMDRFNCDFYQEMVEREINNKFESPDTVHIGGNEGLFDNLAKTFIAAVDSLSITHYLLVRKKIINLYSLLSFEYRNHTLFTSVVKLLVAERDEKKLKQYINRYGETTKHICAEDVSSIQTVVNNEQDFQRRIQLQALVLEFFAYYYSDEEFEEVFGQFIIDAKKAINEDEACTFQYILNVLPEIERRVPIAQLLELIYLLWDDKHERWHNDVFSVIKKLNTLKNAKASERNKLIHNLKRSLSDKKTRQNCPSLLDTIQKVRLSLGKDAISLDAVVKEFSPDYFERPYSVNVFEHSENETVSYMLDLIKALKEQNKTQGKGGAYSQYVYNDFLTIGNILSNAENVIDYKRIKPIVHTIQETLETSTQTCEAKYYALRLLIEIHMLYPRRRDAKRIMESINGFDDIKGNDVFSLQKRYSNQSLLVMFDLAKNYILSFENDTFITDFYCCCEAEQIALMDSLCFLSSVGDVSEIEKLFFEIWPILLMLESSDSEKIQFLVSVVYSNLYGTALEQKSLRRLVSMIEEGACRMKVGAISRLKKRNATGPLVDYIYQQGRVDNNYCVREIANR